VIKIKYKYIGNEDTLISSDNKLITVKKDDIIEFTENDIKYQKLNNFIEIKDKVKKKEIKEED
jgi:hypothetical protein